MRVLLLGLFLTNGFLAAQIDTSIYYPMHIGDKWEYYYPGYGIYQSEILGDTLMPNGRVYYIISGSVYIWRYQRSVNNELVYYYNPPDSSEYILFDFQSPDKTLWKVPFDPYWGIFKTNIDTNNFLNLPIENRIFDRAYIDSTQNIPDTLWGYLIDLYPTRVSKGIGVTSNNYGIETFIGCIINGVGYGTLTEIDNQHQSNITNFNLLQNYPNPFNPITTINYHLPQKSNLEIIVYTASGKRVKTLYEGIKTGGEHTIIFDGSDLSSGIYFVELTAGSFRKSIKTLLLK